MPPPKGGTGKAGAITKASAAETATEGATNGAAGGGGFLSGLFGGMGGGGGMGGLLKMILSMIPGFGALFSMLPMARGGVIGGKMQGLEKGGIARYSGGGIAKQPTYLVGEGKKHEAVVPLPDNRSIPVTMQGSGMTNNTSITVNMGEGTDVSTDGAGELGVALQAAVQEEMVRQQRPGGILAKPGGG